MPILASLAAAITLAGASPPIAPARPPIAYRTIQVDGLSIFYRARPAPATARCFCS